MARGVRVSYDKGINMAESSPDLKMGELTIARNSFYLPETGDLTKVGGRTLFGAMGSTATGLSFVKFRSGDSFLLGSAGTSYFSAPVGQNGTWTAGATGLTDVGPMDAIYYEGSDRAYMADGVNRMQVWTGSGAMRNAGLTQPAQGSVVYLDNTSTSYPTGTTFYYTHTEYSSTNDVESAPADPVSMASSTANGTFKYLFPTATNGSDFDKYRLYRTQHGGNIFYLLAEFTKVSTRYYDGANTEAFAPATINNDIYGFVTVDDLFLSTKMILPMVGEPLKANYITANGTIPIGDIISVFENSLLISGVPDFPQDIYYSMPDFPEMFSPVNYLREGSGRGEPVTGIGKANDRLIAFLTNSIYRHNTLPRPTDPGFGLGVATREQVTSDHGCVAKRSICNFGVGQPNNRLFYLSTRGPMMTDAYETWPLNEDLNWSDQIINFGRISQAVAVNFPKYQQVWLFVPSVSSATNDIAFIYHYHPNHLKKPPVGSWTGPIHIRCAAAAVTYDKDTETRMFTADTNTSGNVYLEDSGLQDASLYENADGDINWEWETGDQPFGEESAHKRVQRVFVAVDGTEEFSPRLTYAVNKSDQENQVPLVNITKNAASTRKLGTSSIPVVKSRTYQGGVWQTGSHFRWHMQETGQAARTISSFEMEVESMGRQK